MPQEPSSSTRKKSGGSPEAGTRAHRAEWVIGIASGLLVATMLVYLVALALSRDGGSPSFSVQVEDTRQVGAHTHVTFVLSNDGERTGAEVLVRATLSDGRDEETREMTFDYVPARSQRRGAFIYDEPVAADRLRLSVLGYRDP